jgi:hypothetical protein
LDLEEVDKVIDDIDGIKPFVFKIPSDVKDNIVTKILATGDETLVDHIHSLASGCCVRPMVLSPSDESLEFNLSFNRFDICTGTTSINLSFIS